MKFIIWLITAFTLLAPSAFGFTYSATSDGVGYCASLVVPSEESLMASTAISIDGLSNTISGKGNLHETHFVDNDAGSIALVSADIQKSSDYKYSYSLVPGSEVQASETLDAWNADYIKAVAIAAYGYGPGAESQITRASTEVTKGSLVGYSNSAKASSSGAQSSQSFDNATGTIKCLAGSKPFAGWVLGHPSGADVSTEAVGSLDGYSSSAQSSSEGLTASQSLINATGTFKAQSMSEYSLYSGVASAEIEVTDGSLARYSSSALASPDKVTSSQSLFEASGAIETSSRSEYIENWERKKSNVSTLVQGDLTEYDLVASSRAAGSEITENSHIVGSFVSDASAGDQSLRRTSDFGNEFDLTRHAKLGKGSGGLRGVPKDSQGYHVSPGYKIQDAINAASNGDTINVHPGTYYENLEIQKSLYIYGSGSGNTIIDGSKKGTVIAIIPTPYASDDPWYYCNLYNLAIKDGSSPMGSGIFVRFSDLDISDISVNLEGCEISGNSASYEGGGIYNSKGTVTLNDCTVHDNHAGYGGGILNRGAVNLNGCEIYANSASVNGGGISKYRGSTLDGDLSSVHDNSPNNICDRW